ncbi:hypothetical protein [Bacillus siamensis]|uniref:hypothetical protein n=1 Tax=Bacillus TaxID=1386 RepID=UPI003F51BA5A
MVSIKKDPIPKSNGNRPRYAMDPDYITVHHTSNTDGADTKMRAKSSLKIIIYLLIASFPIKDCPGRLLNSWEAF